MFSIDCVVVFQCSEKQHWLIKRLERGFRHCFIAFEDDDHWIVIDPLHTHTQVFICDDIEQYAGNGATLLPIQTNIKQAFRGGLCWFNCVEAVKSHIGLKSFFTFTPFQLYGRLIKDRDYVKRNKTSR